MAYDSKQYVGMTQKKNWWPHVKSAQMTRSVYRLVKGLHEHYRTLSSAFMSNGTVKFAGERH